MATPVITATRANDFKQRFEALTGNPPYVWQENLFDLIVQGSFPSAINLPTGAGKTSIMAIWLVALAQQSCDRPQTLTIPRRLVWVVDRRVVVDQATEEAEKIRERLADQNATPALNDVREGLRTLSYDSGKSDLIGISTLRGEKEDNREWSNDPSRPAIIIGTVDMIGSRLLFSGYGDGPYWRAQHAGLLGQDALIINDEAHLTPAFANLIRTIESIQENRVKPFRTVRLSATHPDQNCWPESLDEDRKHPHFKKIFEATKKLHIQVESAAKVESAIMDLATQKGIGRTIIFVTEPEKAQKLAEAIQKKVGSDSAKRVLTLTGTMRGFERDQLVEEDEFKVFTTAAKPQGDYWLVATSAGEVGINISSDQLITTLDTLDHLLQRFGRLNRFGETEGVAHLICSEKEKNVRKAAALEFLRSRLPQAEGVYDISPRTLFGLSLDADACTEPPLIAPLHPWHVDVWSQTSAGEHPSRPPVAPWLHGAEKNVPETYVAWREEVRILERPEGSLISDDDRQEVLDKYHLLAHEQLREPTYKLVEKLSALFSKENLTAVGWRRKNDGTVDKIQLPKITKDIDLRKNTDKAIQELAYCQLILPAGFGRPENGMFQPEWLPPIEIVGSDKAEKKDSIPYDVSGTQLREDPNANFPERRASYLATPIDDKAWSLKRLGGNPKKVYSIERLPEWNRFELEKFAKDHDWRFLFAVIPEGEETSSAPEQRLVYFGPAYEKKAATKKLFVDQHNSDVSRLAEVIAGKLALPAECVLALRESGKRHDLGKKEPVWQRAAGNWDVEQGCLREAEPVAKPIVFMKGRQLGGFRHEFASLRHAKAELSRPEIDSGVLELALHLIASHHGHGRPYFQSKAYDKSQSLRDQKDLVLETVKRFAKLQQRFGAWGLVYLESILRAADAIASKDAQEQPEGA